MWSEIKFNSSFGMSNSFVNEGIGDKTCQLMNKIETQNTLQIAIKVRSSYNGVKPTDSQVLAPFVIRDRAMLVNKDN